MVILLGCIGFELIACCIQDLQHEYQVGVWLQGSLQQELESLSEGHEHYSRIEHQLEEAQAQLRQLQTSEDAAVGALQSAQEAQQALQDAETFQAAVQADQDGGCHVASANSSSTRCCGTVCDKHGCFDTHMHFSLLQDCLCWA